MAKIYAKVKTFNAGYDSQQEEMKNLFKLNQKIEVDSIVVHSSSTEIYLIGHEYSFNSVFFEIVDEEGDELDYIHGDECERLRSDWYN